MSERPAAQKASKSGESNAAMTRASQEVLRLIPKADGCGVALVVGDQLVEASRAGNIGGLDQLRLGINESMSGLAFLSGSAFRCDDTAKGPFVDHATTTRLGVGSFVSVPLRDGIRAIGIFIAASRERAAFNDRDVEILVSAAQSLEDELAPRARRIRRFANRNHRYA
ncbi:MAG: GAF domain-containing protein [Acidimicrobiales bacterium]